MKLEDILKVCDCKKQIIDTDKNLISENAEYKNVYEFLNCEVVDINFEDYLGIKITINKNKKNIINYRCEVIEK